MKALYGFVIGASLATCLIGLPLATAGALPFDIMWPVAVIAGLICTLFVVLYLYADGITHPSLKDK